MSLKTKPVEIQISDTSSATLDAYAKANKLTATEVMELLIEDGLEECESDLLFLADLLSDCQAMMASEKKQPVFH